MTTKEAEHWLIELGFEWDRADESWHLKTQYYPVISDWMVTHNPDRAIDMALREIRKIKARDFI